MDRLGIDLPVVQAPMGGGPSTVEMAAAVSGAGGLGSLAGGYLSPDRLRTRIRELRAATDRPFAVNLFVPTPVTEDPGRIARARALLGRYRAELGLEGDAGGPPWSEDFSAQVEVVIAERVPVFSFTFGPLPAGVVDALHHGGTVVIGTATNAAEAVELRDGGCDLICAQGGEAGGHHGTWLADGERSVIGTMALVPLVCDAVDVPVVAAGGIMDARGVAAALCLGAGAAQMGTAFMLCPEAGTPAPHRKAIRSARETDVLLTGEVTGRLARGVRNRLMDELRGQEVPPYPIMNALTREIRRASAGRDDPELMSLWCGQAVPLVSQDSAGQIARAAAEGVAAVAARLG